jgi:hypothetical protein
LSQQFQTAKAPEFFKINREAGRPVWTSNLEFRSLNSLPVSLNKAGRDRSKVETGFNGRAPRDQ